jgi:hypothetical protein
MLIKRASFSAGLQPILFCKEVLLSPVKMFLGSKLPCLGWSSADFLQVFFLQKCLLDQRKHTRSSTKISTYGIIG